VAYVPDHVTDVFISYCHDDDFAWIERFKEDLGEAFKSKLRARTKLEVFFDAKDLRAGRVFDAEIEACLKRAGFFLAIVSVRYNTSEYCRHEEFNEFLRHHPPQSGRLIQIQLDLSADLPRDDVQAVRFAGKNGPFRAGTDDYRDALRRVYEPIVTELDRLYAESKMVFLAWPGDRNLREDRKQLKSEIEGRGLRVFPEIVAELDSKVDVRLREALSQSTTSVHLFGREPDAFDLRQWDAAVRLGKPCILASHSPTEARRGPAGSPPPVYLDQGNPTNMIATAVEQIAGIGKREDRQALESLGRTPIFLVHEPGSDRSLGLRIGKRISGCGPFEVIVPPSDSGARYDALARAKVALVCRAKAGHDWLKKEFDALGAAMMAAQRFDLRRALLLLASDDIADLDLLEDDAVLRSEHALDSFLMGLQGAAA
jgi:TIR domain